MDESKGLQGHFVSLIAAMIGSTVGGSLIPWIVFGMPSTDTSTLILGCVCGIVTGTLPGWTAGLFLRLAIEKRAWELNSTVWPSMFAFVTAVVFTAVVLCSFYTYLATALGGI